SLRPAAAVPFVAGITPRRVDAGAPWRAEAEYTMDGDPTALLGTYSLGRTNDGGYGGYWDAATETWGATQVWNPVEHAASSTPLRRILSIPFPGGAWPNGFSWG